jgi:uncharacterized protein
MKVSQAYVDANVFVYAFLKTKRQLQPNELEMKQVAKNIVARISKGEKVTTSVVHFSEVCNILEDHLPPQEAILLEKGLLYRENISICEVAQKDYIKAVSIAEDHHVGVNDALAYVIMKEQAIQTIYSFDKELDAFTDIQRIIK